MSVGPVVKGSSSILSPHSWRSGPCRHPLPPNPELEGVPLCTPLAQISRPAPLPRRDRTKRWLGVTATCPLAYFTWRLGFSSLRGKGKGEKEVEKNFPCSGSVRWRGHSDLDVCNSGRAFADTHIVRKRTGLMS